MISLCIKRCFSASYWLIAHTADLQQIKAQKLVPDCLTLVGCLKLQNIYGSGFWHSEQTFSKLKNEYLLQRRAAAGLTECVSPLTERGDKVQSECLRIH